MTISTCPIAVVNAPIERVWSFLSEPANYDLWWEVQTRAIVPEGRAHAGQKIYAQASALGKQLDMSFLVQGLDESKHQLDLITNLPFGITGFNHLTCTALSNSTTQVSFG